MTFFSLLRSLESLMLKMIIAGGPDGVTAVTLLIFASLASSKLARLPFWHMLTVKSGAGRPEVERAVRKRCRQAGALWSARIEHAPLPHLCGRIRLQLHLLPLRHALLQPQMPCDARGHAMPQVHRLMGQSTFACALQVRMCAAVSCGGRRWS